MQNIDYPIIWIIQSNECVTHEKKNVKNKDLNFIIYEKRKIGILFWIIFASHYY